MMRRFLIALAAAIVPSVASAQVEVRLIVPEVRVRVAPPPVRVEVQPERRSPDQIWIPGHWAVRGNQNIWIPGVWTNPPQEGMVWEKERWTQRNGAWFYAEGHWRLANPPPPTHVYVAPPVRDDERGQHAPPRRIAERRPPPPFRNAIWIPGFWRWDGSEYNWVAGHYSARPDRRAVWTPDRWRREPARERGQKEIWVRVPGHWNRR